VLFHLPKRDRPAVKRRLRQAWALDDHGTALERLRGLAGELERSHPGAAASLREGLEETLTVSRLGVRGALKQTLQSTDENVKGRAASTWPSGGVSPRCGRGRPPSEAQDPGLDSCAAWASR